MYGRENEERRERGIVDRERKHEKRKEESDGAQGLLFLFIYGGGYNYPQQQKFSSSKISLPSKIRI